jgi:multicomponent Na+:H+ antiporter subunit B
VISAFEAALFLFILVTTLATTLFRDIIAVIIVFAAYSLGMALFYAFLLAPDVAMTEAAIGAGVTTLLLLLTITKTARGESERVIAPIDTKALVVFGALFVVLAATITEFPAVGSNEAIAWTNPGVTQYYIEQSYSDTGVENAVTAVLAGYRGFDTFGEAVVVFSAGIAVLISLKQVVFTRE